MSPTWQKISFPSIPHFCFAAESKGALASDCLFTLWWPVLLWVYEVCKNYCRDLYQHGCKLKRKSQACARSKETSKNILLSHFWNKYFSINYQRQKLGWGCFSAVQNLHCMLVFYCCCHAGPISTWSWGQPLLKNYDAWSVAFKHSSDTILWVCSNFLNCHCQEVKEELLDFITGQL